MENMNVKELREIAKNKKIKNWWKMTKAQLIAELTEEEKVEETTQVETSPNTEKNLKVIYCEKDEKIHVIKDHGSIWPLWYKYKDLGYKNIMAFDYEKVFGDKIDTNKRTRKKSNFMRKWANSDVNITHEEFEKSGGNDAQ